MGLRVEEGPPSEGLFIVHAWEVTSPRPVTSHHELPVAWTPSPVKRPCGVHYTLSALTSEGLCAQKASPEAPTSLGHSILSPYIDAVFPNHCHQPQM